MSQRLLLCQETENVGNFDCVLKADTQCPEAKILDEFFRYKDGIFLGPWRICIRDEAVYRQHEYVIGKTFGMVGRKFPEDVWIFSMGEREMLFHPSREELDNWINHGS